MQFTVGRNIFWMSFLIFTQIFFYKNFFWIFTFLVEMPQFMNCVLFLLWFMMFWKGVFQIFDIFLNLIVKPNYFKCIYLFLENNHHIFCICHFGHRDRTWTGYTSHSAYDAKSTESNWVKIDGFLSTERGQRRKVLLT